MFSNGFSVIKDFQFDSSVAVHVFLRIFLLHSILTWFKWRSWYLIVEELLVIIWHLTQEYLLRSCPVYVGRDCLVYGWCFTPGHWPTTIIMSSSVYCANTFCTPTEGVFVRWLHNMTASVFTLAFNQMKRKH